GLFVAEIDHLARRVGNRIVAPGGEPVHLAVAGPGIARPSLGDEEPEGRVGNDVRPGGRRQGRVQAGTKPRPTVAARVVDGPAADVQVILPSIGREPPESILEQQGYAGRGRPLLRIGGRLATGNERGGKRGGPFGPVKLDVEQTTLADQDD